MSVARRAMVRAEAPLTTAPAPCGCAADVALSVPNLSLSRWALTIRLVPELRQFQLASMSMAATCVCVWRGRMQRCAEHRCRIAVHCRRHLCRSPQNGELSIGARFRAESTGFFSAKFVGLLRIGEKPPVHRVAGVLLFSEGSPQPVQCSAERSKVGMPNWSPSLHSQHPLPIRNAAGTPS